MYTLQKGPVGDSYVSVFNYEANESIPFSPANTDYQTFKAQILADEAELEDSDGNLMTPSEAKAFIQELP